MRTTKNPSSVLTVNSQIYSPQGLIGEIKKMVSTLMQDGVIDTSCKLSPYFDNFTVVEYFNDVFSRAGGDLDGLNYSQRIELYTDLRKFYSKTSNLNKYPKDLIVKMLRAGCYGDFKKDDIDAFEVEILREENKKSNFANLFGFLTAHKNSKIDFDFNFTRYKTLFHELGHLQSYLYNYHFIITDFRNPQAYNPTMRKWLENYETMQAAFAVSPYACYGVPEFIAEAFALQLQGLELPENSKKLYKSLHGPKVKLQNNV
ncbi:MAG: hypothetical protein IKU37_05415 [Candidatus Gastranaerophilales bacterium]|nr:hypothetical protein [Candidatus Gastranaerophilales bacterium]